MNKVFEYHCEGGGLYKPYLCCCVLLDINKNQHINCLMHGVLSFIFIFPRKCSKFSSKAPFRFFRFAYSVPFISFRFFRFASSVSLISLIIFFSVLQKSRKQCALLQFWQTDKDLPPFTTTHCVQRTFQDLVRCFRYGDFLANFSKTVHHTEVLTENLPPFTTSLNTKHPFQFQILFPTFGYIWFWQYDVIMTHYIHKSITMDKGGNTNASVSIYVKMYILNHITFW